MPIRSCRPSQGGRASVPDLHLRRPLSRTQRLGHQSQVLVSYLLSNLSALADYRSLQRRPEGLKCRRGRRATRTDGATEAQIRLSLHTYNTMSS